MNKEYIWKVVYDMDGRGLADWLNEFENTDVYESSRYGERVYTNVWIREIFSEWSKWRWECSYYFNGLLEAIEESELNLTDNQVIEILVFGICRTLQLIGDAENEPKEYKQFLFC